MGLFRPIICTAWSTVRTPHLASNASQVAVSKSERLKHAHSSLHHSSSVLASALYQFHATTRA
eukprot:3447498-Alexandrium_andersonii.AAC.1